MIKTLVVEDEEIIRRLLVCSIDWVSLGCTIPAEASDGEEGLRRIREIRPELIITDVAMPVMDGIEMLEKAKDICPSEYIILTGYDEFEYARKAVSLGVSDYILKPIDEEKLVAAIRKVVQKILEKREYRRFRERKEEPAGAEFQIDELQAACSDHYVKEILQDMKEHYSEHLSIASYAARLDVSSGYLSRKFKAETSMSFGKALQSVRVQKACELMAETNRKIYEIAYAVGYDSYKNFCEVFKQVTGKSASEYAAMQKENMK